MHRLDTGFMRARATTSAPVTSERSSTLQGMASRAWPRPRLVTQVYRHDKILERVSAAELAQGEELERYANISAIVAIAYDRVAALQHRGMTVRSYNRWSEEMESRLASSPPLRERYEVLLHRAIEESVLARR